MGLPYPCGRPLCVESGGVLEHAHGKEPREVNLGCGLFQNIKAAFGGGFGVLNMWKMVNDLHEREILKEKHAEDLNSICNSKHRPWSG